jgi:hypothetical protein
MPVAAVFAGNSKEDRRGHAANAKSFTVSGLFTSVDASVTPVKAQPALTSAVSQLSITFALGNDDTGLNAV